MVAKKPQKRMPNPTMPSIDADGFLVKATERVVTHGFTHPARKLPKGRL